MKRPIIITNLYPHHLRFEPMRISLEASGFCFHSFLASEHSPITYYSDCDAMFIFNYPMNPQIADYIIERNKSGKPSVVMMDDPIAFFTASINDSIQDVLRRASRVYTSTDNMVPIYQSIGINARLIVGLANPLFDIPEVPNEDAMTYDWGYIGSLYPQRFRFFWKVKRLLPDLTFSIVESGLNTSQVIERIRQTRVNVAYGNFSDIVDFRSNGTTFRSWEFPYSRAFLVQEYRPLLGNFFKEGFSMVSFRSEEECAERIRYYINRPHERNFITKNARDVISQYTMLRILPEIFNDVLEGQ